MPEFKKWSSQQQATIIWHITEPDSFFIEQTALNSTINSQKRRLEFLAGRFLLQYLVPHFPLDKIAPDENDKPRLANNEWHFSISHSFPFVAVAVSKTQDCGIDLQTYRPNMLRLQHKFLSPKEQSLFMNDERLLTLAWCAKEAAYKWNGKRGVDFIEQLPIVSFHQEKCMMEIAVNHQQKILLQGGLEEAFAWMLVVV